MSHELADVSTGQGAASILSAGKTTADVIFQFFANPKPEPAVPAPSRKRERKSRDEAARPAKVSSRSARWWRAYLKNHRNRLRLKRAVAVSSRAADTSKKTGLAQRSPIGRRLSKSDLRFNEIFERLHGQESEEYYSTELRSPVRSTLSGAAFVVVTHRDNGAE
jgi:hypothetical protein